MQHNRKNTNNRRNYRKWGDRQPANKDSVEDFSNNIEDIPKFIWKEVEGKNMYEVLVS